ncbi:hypothetical protein Pmar_PMAR026690 [Perkinsus marinus ATCC 50983]|uniref:Uncharacterized protein n=1 Tax=Perkinsus marinus (strain ATCC 50983 / TXsc) TaxID=423536 RepID=C5LWC4_PERM5|nr:hypothetical protein Pmar_PMAR026690 [Perkinsus marinus ATCC 50983]EEQ98966.1 hypothetical protein Pmar_PMAR026690 [Perkinsus marinus ATCC 50983]|eukprot:XP_002766249.1 hypothetical protein Pmar_PMAR026690 [Perkinsus marinus ATCC 50983]
MSVIKAARPRLLDSEIPPFVSLLPPLPHLPGLFEGRRRSSIGGMDLGQAGLSAGVGAPKFGAAEFAAILPYLPRRFMEKGGGDPCEVGHGKGGFTLAYTGMKCRFDPW